MRKSCEFSLFPPNIILIQSLIIIQGGTLIIDSCAIKNQNFSLINTLIELNFQEKIVLSNFLFMQNIFPARLFSISAFSIIFEGINFSNNTVHMALTLKIFDIRAYVKHESYSNESFFFLNNSIFFQNSFATEIFSISSFSFIDIRNSRNEENFFGLGFNILLCSNVSFQNSTFYRNNKIENFYTDSRQSLKINEYISMLGTYGASIQLQKVSYIQALSVIFFANYAYSSQTAGITLFECDFFLLAESEFINNTLERGMKDAGACFQFISTMNGLIKLERNYFSKNIIKNNEENIDEEYAACSVMKMPDGNISISHSIFSENLSPKYLCLNILSNKIIINNCSFINHTHDFVESDLAGSIYEKFGVLVVDFADMIVSDCAFSFNVAVKGSAITIKRTIYKYQFLLAENCNFYGNLAFLLGSSLFVDSSDSFRSFFMRSCFFVKGVSQRKSATLNFEVENGNFIQNFTFTECFFIQNVGESSSSIMEYFPSYPLNAFIYFLNSLFLNNLKIGNSAMQGGLFDIWGEAVDDTSVAVYFKDCIFKGFFNLFNF